MHQSTKILNCKYWDLFKSNHLKLINLNAPTSRNTHNNNRITRILSFLSLTDRTHLQIMWLEFIVKEIKKKPSFRYWLYNIKEKLNYYFRDMHAYVYPNKLFIKIRLN